jgi:hypothetical protein
LPDHFGNSVPEQGGSSRLARRRRIRAVDETAEVPDVPITDPAADVDLERAIAQLAERQQLAVHLHYFVGLSVNALKLTITHPGMGRLTFLGV